MRKKIEGCLFGMALGDALGAPTEFLDYAGIQRRYGEDGIQDLPGNPAKVTDDTQMALAVGYAIVDAPRPYSVETFEPILRKYFIDWYNDPENNRAPGNTCLTSIERLMETPSWVKATNISSKGCGANMRVQAVGLLPDDAKTRSGLAQFQSAITHAHSTALASADITAWVIHDLAHDGDIDTLVDRCIDYARSQRQIYHENWLGRLHERAYMFPDGTHYIAHGWDEVIGKLGKVVTALEEFDYKADPCVKVGASWIAEEAFATALYCFLLYPTNPTKAIIRGANSSGDSDSIACIAGAFAGAYCGIDAWDTSWLERIEYKSELQTLADKLTALHSESDAI